MKLTNQMLQSWVWFLWIAAFMACSIFLMNYENIMNKTGLDSNQIVFQGSSSSGKLVHNVNLFNEGPGFFFLGLIGFSAVMFVRQTKTFLRSLGYEGDIFAFKEVKMSK
jgi:hypothetical protein